ncbi:tautomerase family protein [Halarcobacter ebronensis]|uniref:Tautomerase family protein n=1 Tax=Halarcobacter ebronensis TaxID=1462615 RepID=A0A4Q1ATK7_9BACT|nr:tautomerase family protein [Halarcobacter ebronensis]QKF81771.1 tautomerase family protein [Halarcobacter ebronensis]RXK04553.1 tautomerase family protein [Halarcobacter ebronensis]
MPFVRIYTNTKSKEEKMNISDSIHSSLMKHFHIPLKDKFHVFTQVNKENLVFPDEYLNVKYKEIIYINILCKEGRTIEQKKNLYKACSEAIEKSTSYSKSSVFISISETSIENWSFGDGLAQMLEI